MTDSQRTVALKVISAWRHALAYYRAVGSGERVTLASLYRSGVLERRCWRGVDGTANAAYEYRPSNNLLIEVARASCTGSIAESMPVHKTCARVVKP